MAYAEFGQSDGHPVIYCHAAPSARLEPLIIGEEIFRQYGLWVIAPDRPGMGESDFQPKREFSDYVKDVVFLADTLGLEKFSVVGISGGSGYAAACAARIPERLSKVVIASGYWKIDKEVIKTIDFPMNSMWITALRVPFLLPLVMKMMIKFMTQEPKENSKEKAATPNDVMLAVDHEAMSQPERMVVYLQTLRETVKQGTKGAAWDIRMYVREWDFAPAEIQVPLTLFHGGLDRNVPLALVEEMAKRLPDARLVTYPEDGHVSIYINHADEIAQALLP